jgi:hypothetical protein
MAARKTTKNKTPKKRKTAPKKKTAPKTKTVAKKNANQNKTKPNKASVTQFLSAIQDDDKRKDTKKIIAMMKRVTGERPQMWGSSLIGFGTYTYKYASGRQGDWPLTAVSPRKGNISVYIMPGFAPYGGLMKKLGKHKTGKSCLYIKRLSDVHVPTLEKLIARSVKDMRKRYEDN